MSRHRIVRAMDYSEGNTYSFMTQVQFKYMGLQCLAEIVHDCNLVLL
jgi:hypothetical protein